MSFGLHVEQSGSHGRVRPSGSSTGPLTAIGIAFVVFGLPFLLKFENGWIIPIGTGILTIVVITRLRGVQGWVLDGQSIRKQFAFKGFPEAVDFVSKLPTLFWGWVDQFARIAETDGRAY